MRHHTRLIMVTVALLCGVTLSAAPAAAATDAGYEQLLELFLEFREVTLADGDDFGALSLYERSAILAQGNALGQFQSRLRKIDSSSWSIPRQVDYHLVRAEMNGLEFRHRVLKPWFRDPGTYADMVLFLGERTSGSIDSDELEGIRETLRSIPEIFAHAKINLENSENIPADLAELAIRDLSNGRDMFSRLAAKIDNANSDLVNEINRAAGASDDLLEWLLANQADMTSAAGVGRENYNWLLKNVYLFPYTWDELRTIVELEDNRVIAFQRLEENRNKNVPRIDSVQSQDEYKASVAAAIDDIMAFLQEEQIFTMPEYLTPEGYFGSWHGFDNPWPEKHDYFFNFSHREPRMEEAHEMVGHHFDQLRGQNNIHPIRKGWRPYKISTARTEGFAFALEELLMYAGYLDKRSPRAREIAYEQAAFRTVRALSDIYMHDNQWSLRDAMEYSVANAPHGELLDNSPHLWFEMATTLRGVGHHMLMVVGKVQFIKLLRDSAQQQRDEFELQAFMDQFFESGLIPMALIRWEMTGREDEVSKLW